MNAHEVPEPILNSPFEEPEAHWWITEHDPPERRAGRRAAMYFYRQPGREPSQDEGIGTAIELKLVNRIRAKLAEWRPLALRGEGGVTRTTVELLRYWRRECMPSITGKRSNTNCVMLMRATHAASGRGAQPPEAAGNPWWTGAAQVPREPWDRFARIRAEADR